MNETMAPRLRVGDEVPVLERELSTAALMAYGAATWDWHRLHYDLEYVRDRQLSGPVVDGQLFGALCAQAITAWLGPLAFITKLSYRMRSMVFAGETVHCEGEVTAVTPEADCLVVTLEQRVLVEDRVAARASATVRVGISGPV